MNKKKYNSPEEARAARNKQQMESYYRLRKERIAAGLCTNCGGEREPSRAGKRLCFLCARQAADRMAAMRARKALDKTE